MITLSREMGGSPRVGIKSKKMWRACASIDASGRWIAALGGRLRGLWFCDPKVRVHTAAPCLKKVCFKDSVVIKKAKKLSARKLSIASELCSVFENNRLVVLFHYNDLNTSEWDKLRLALDKDNLKVRIFPSKVSAKVLQETRYRSIIPLFRGCTAVAFGRDPSVSSLLSHTKSEAKLLLLGGIVDNQLFTPKRLREYAALPPVEVIHRNILGTLQRSQLMLSMLLQDSSQKLSYLLNSVCTR